MKRVKQTYDIKAPVEKVWQALVDPKVIDDWGAGPAEMSDKEGSSFKLWGGDIYGKNIEVVDSKKLVQDWFGGDWEKPSKVTINLSSSADETKVELVHEDIPDGEAKGIEDGWKRYYFGPLKDLLEK